MKVSFAVALLLGNISAQDAATSGDQTCNCDTGMFCNNDIGPNKGFCESCEEFNNAQSCETSGLPSLGVQACKSQCFANNSLTEPSADEYAEVSDSRMATNSTYAATEVDENLSRDARQITRAIDDLQRQIPAAGVSGKISYSVNTAPFKSGLDLDKEFFNTDFKKFENAVQEVMGTPLQNAKLQIATQFAGVANATFDVVEAQMKQAFPDGEKCQARPFYDCLQTLQRWERRGPKIFRTQCAIDSGCDIQQQTDEQHQASHDVENAWNQKMGNLAQSVAGEFEEVANKQGQIIDGVGNKWMNKDADWMKSDMKCDADCVDRYMKYRSWTDFNGFDIMMRCPCEIPIKVAPVQDFEGKDFYKMTAADHLTILADAAAGDATETAQDKAKRIAKETAAKAKKAGQEGVDKLNEASGGKAMYIIGGVAVVCLGGIAYYCMTKDKEDSEGGQDDRFSTLL